MFDKETKPEKHFKEVYKVKQLSEKSENKMKNKKVNVRFSDTIFENDTNFEGWFERKRLEGNFLRLEKALRKSILKRKIRNGADNICKILLLIMAFFYHFVCIRLRYLC